MPDGRNKVLVIGLYFRGCASRIFSDNQTAGGWAVISGGDPPDPLWTLRWPASQIWNL
jgi:hypothetical protein